MVTQYRIHATVTFILTMDISNIHGYQQYTIQIDWSYSDRILEKNSMHRGYNTNFQKFEYLADSNELLIFDNNFKITIAEGD